MISKKCLQTMLRDLRKNTLKKEDNIEDFIGGRSRKFYIEKNYKTIKLYRYLLYLRMKGADLNSFFDSEISDKNKIKKL